MAARSDRRHRPRVRQRQLLPLLQLPQEHTRFDAGLLGERWGPDRPLKPDEILIGLFNSTSSYVRLDIPSSGGGAQNTLNRGDRTKRTEKIGGAERDRTVDLLTARPFRGRHES
jgi:hypothetical protein